LSNKKLTFREAAMRSGLVTDDQLNEAANRVKQKLGATKSIVAEVSDRDLAAMMVSLEYLTAYQADQLLEGKTKLTLGPYIITDWIGQGGMGQVFKAVHELMGRETAVKVLPREKSTAEAIENFRREIRIQAKLDHPNLVRAYDAGMDGVQGKETHYLVVEFVDGTDLRRLVRSKGMMSMQQAASIIKQAAEGLEYAHQRGLIHRDIKPGNILVTASGIAKVSDLGLAGHFAESDGRSGKIVGTADYLAPEQIHSPAEVSKSADIYALGCTLYYSITGKVPFPGGNTKSKARRHLDETPWHPRRFNPEVSDEFVDLIGDMMEKNPRQRIQSAADVAERLAPWAADQSQLLAEVDHVRARWSTRISSGEGDQDTDPAANQLSDEGSGGDSSTSESEGSRSNTSSGSNTSVINDSSDTSLRPPKNQLSPPAPPLVAPREAATPVRGSSVEPGIPLTWVVIVGMTCVGIGTLVGILFSAFAFK
jgi:serine/threonine protein kinase